MSEPAKNKAAPSRLEPGSPVCEGLALHDYCEDRDVHSAEREELHNAVIDEDADAGHGSPL